MTKVCVLASLSIILMVCLTGIGSENSKGVEERIARITAGIIPISENHEPQFEQRVALADRMSFHKTPGVGLAIIDDYRIVWAGGFGTLRAGGEERVDAGTLFNAGSVAKPLSAAAALTLVSGGKLDVDADVNRWLKTWRIPENEFTKEEKVTLRRLLSHCGGIEDGFTNRSSGDALPDYFVPEGQRPGVALVDLLEAKPGVDVDGPTRVTAVPGTRYRYANADYVILQLLVEDVTGQPYKSFMEESLLEPLGLRSSTYAQPLPEELRRRASIEHDFGGKPLEGNRLHAPFLAAGGLWTTPSDLATFVIEIMSAYQGKPERLLSQEMAAQMLAPQMAITGSPLADAVTMGFERSGSGVKLAVEHTGATWGSVCVLWAHPVTGQGAVIMLNSAAGSMLRFEILLAIAVEYGWPMLA